VTSKPVDLAVIVSVIQNRLLCSFDAYREFLDFQCGRHVALWDVERARKAVAGRLLKQFPELAKIPRPPDKTDSGNANKHIRACGKALGGIECYTLAPAKVKLGKETLAQALR
jgi:hypothetical protein